jgi:hypothetical protein
VTAKTAARTAARMGTRAGVAFRALGTPTRCPFPPRTALARAWARGYIIARGRGRRG